MNTRSMAFLTGSFRNFSKLRFGLAVLFTFLAILVHVFRTYFLRSTVGYVHLPSFFKPFVPSSSTPTASRKTFASLGHIKHLLFHINIEGSFGKIIRIDYTNEQSKQVPNTANGFVSLAIRLDDYQWPVTTSTNDIKHSHRRNNTHLIGRFVYVLSFWEQSSRSTISLLDLALLNQFTQRRVVVPRVNNSSMGSNGENLHFYVNVSYLNKLLEESGVSGLIDEAEFSKECGMHSREPNLTVHFLYKLYLNSHATANFGRKKTDDLMRNLKEKSWVDCTSIVEARKGNSEVCVNPLNLYHTEFLENEIFRNTKCVVLSEWRGLGDDANLRLNLHPSAPPSHSFLIQYRLELSEIILSEARTFVKMELKSSVFLAVHVRAEKLLVPSFMAMERLGTCLEILVEGVALMRSQLGIQNVFLLADFGKHGSGTLPKNHTAKLTTLHGDLVKSLNATCYHPNSQSRAYLADRGVVALIEMTIASLSNHLVTVGGGSFQDWLVSKFLRNNRRQGSVLKICTKTWRFKFKSKL